MATVDIKSIEKSFGSVEVLKGVDLAIADGEFIVLLGPSGCGKSTLLRIIAGLEDESAGSIHIGGREVSHLSPSKREIAMVFQSYALYPHLDVSGNWSLGLKQAGEKAALIDERIKEASRVLELDDLLHRRPAELSGGQRQRVAIGRAIVRHPEVFLFDEPLSNLDAALRAQVRFEIAHLHKRLGATMIYVTHDQIEAMTLATRVVVLNEGRVQQVGTPAELYKAPSNIFVAGFIGSPKMNMIKSESTSSGLSFDKSGEIACDHGLAAGLKLTTGVRSDGVFVASEGVSAEVRLSEYLGRQSYLHVVLKDGTPLVIEIDAEAEYETGSVIQVGFLAAHLHFFDETSGERVATGR